jgi:hypothetical protein
VEKKIKLSQIIQLAHDEDRPIKTRVIALGMLQQLGTPESLVAVCKISNSERSQIAHYCEEIIQSLESSRLIELLDYALEGEEQHHTEKRFLDLIHRLRKKELFKYVLTKLGQADPDTHKYRIVQRWIKESQMTKEYVRIILSAPTDTGKKIARELSRIDSRLANELAEIARRSPSAQHCLDILDILSTLVEPDNSPASLVNLMKHSDSKVRSKSATIIGSCSKNVLLFKRLLSDPDERVRANAIETMAKLDWEAVQNVVMPYLADEIPRIRANAAKVIYEHGNRHGLETLMDMLDSSDSKMRVSGLWTVGKVREITASDRLQKLVNDASEEEDVLRHASAAFEEINRLAVHLDGQITELAHQLNRFKEEEDIESTEPVFYVLEALTGHSKAELIKVVQGRSNIPEMGQLQMKSWMDKISSEAMMLIVLIAFWETSAIPKDEEALFVPMHFQESLEDYVDALKSPERTRKMAALGHFSHTARLIDI